MGDVTVLRPPPLPLSREQRDVVAFAKRGAPPAVPIEPDEKVVYAMTSAFTPIEHMPVSAYEHRTVLIAYAWTDLDERPPAIHIDRALALYDGVDWVNPTTRDELFYDGEIVTHVALIPDEPTPATQDEARALLECLIEHATEADDDYEERCS